MALGKVKCELPRLVMETGRYLTLAFKGKKHTYFIRHVWFGKPEPKQSSDWYVAVWDVNELTYSDILISDLHPL